MLAVAQPIRTPSRSKAPLANPMSRLTRGFTYTTIAFLLVPFPLLALGRGAALLAACLAAPLALAMAIATVVCAFYGRKVSQRLKAFQRGAYIAHWKCTLEEWEAFGETEAERAGERARRSTTVGIFVGGLTGLVVGAVAGSVWLGGIWGTLLIGLLGCLALGLIGEAVGALIGVMLRRSTARRIRDFAGEREVYVGPDAAYCAGSFWTWKAFNTWLAGLRCEPGDPYVMAFTVRTKMPRGGNIDHEYRIPLPWSRHDDAKRVLRLLNRVVES